MENPLRLIEPSESDVPVWTVSADGLESWLDAQMPLSLIGYGVTVSKPSPASI